MNISVKLILVLLTAVMVFFGYTLYYHSIDYTNLNPIAFTIFNFPVHWYGLFYLFGLCGALLLNYLMATSEKDSYYAKVSPSQFTDLAMNAFLGAIVGGRIGYVLFYNLGEFLHNPIEIFYIHKGGMSFHGGFLGATLTILYQTRKQKDFWLVADLGASVIPFALGLGRIANFINGELWGRVTEVRWAVNFHSGGGLPRHPSQLYESFLEGYVLLVLLLVLRSLKLDRPGLLAGTFVAGYGISRIIIEFFRQPDAQIGYYFGVITQGQILSLPMVIIGLYIVYSSKKRSFAQA